MNKRSNNLKSLGRGNLPLTADFRFHYVTMNEDKMAWEFPLSFQIDGQINGDGHIPRFESLSLFEAQILNGGVNPIPK